MGLRGLQGGSLAQGISLGQGQASSMTGPPCWGVWLPGIPSHSSCSHPNAPQPWGPIATLVVCPVLHAPNGTVACVWT